MKGESLDFEAPTKKGGRPKKPAPRKRQRTTPVSATAAKGAAALKEKINNILGSKRSLIDINEIAMEFLHQFGGPRGFVTTIMQAYDSAPQGSPEQARMLDAILRMYDKAQARTAITDLDTVSDRDLEAMIQEKLSKVGLNKEEIAQAMGKRIEVLEYPDHVCI